MKMKSALRRHLILAASSLFAVPQSHAQDQDGSWLGDSAGDWTDGTKWTDGLIANGADFTATFGNVITTARTITLNGNRTIGNITASDTSHHFTLTGNTLTLDRTSGVPTINVVSNRELTIESIVAGDDGVQKSGGGTLTLKGTNTFSGGLTIKAGTVRNNNTGSGGNFLGYYVTFGEYDWMLIYENSDELSALAGTIIGAASGTATGMKTTLAFTGAQAKLAFERAQAAVAQFRAAGA